MLHRGFFKSLFPVLAISLLLLALQNNARVQTCADNAKRQAEQFERDRATGECQRQLEWNRLDNQRTPQ